VEFKIDENLPVELAVMLKTAGYGASTVVEESISGAPDEPLAQVCVRGNRILVTLDLDFSDISTYPPADYPGFIVLRLRRQDKPSVMAVFQQVLGRLQQNPLANELWIVEEQRVRIRRGTRDA